jgi:uncharacterized protein YeaC (DUF1315 family)
MKVKITYTTRYEDVPNVINDILNKCRTELKRSSELRFDILRLKDTAVEVAKVQDTLDLVSSQLEDCLNLCQGYAQVQEHLTDENEETQDLSEDADEKNE